jgi:hypothetical protein
MDLDMPHHMDVDTDMGMGMDMDGHEHRHRHDQMYIAKKYCGKGLFRTRLVKFCEILTSRNFTFL